VRHGIDVVKLGTHLDDSIKPGEVKFIPTESTEHIVGVSSLIMNNLATQSLLVVHHVPVDGIVEAAQVRLDCLFIFELSASSSTFAYATGSKASSSSERGASSSLRLAHGLTPNQALVFVEVGRSVHSNVHFNEASLGFDAHLHWSSAGAIVVGLIPATDGVL
jgi:hypothetical protein